MLKPALPRFPVDLSLLEGHAHMPSVVTLQKRMELPLGTELKDFCIPVNPYFPTPEFTEALKDGIARVLKFYPSTNERVSEELAAIVGIDPAHLVMGNGSTELITWIDHLWIKSSILTSVPTFGRWTDQPRETGKKLHFYFRTKEDGFQIDSQRFIKQVRASGARVVAISNPNNPTGALMPKEQALEIIDALADLDLVVIDESFIDFSEREIPSVAREACARSNVVVLKSLGKNFGLHGVRFGYAVANPRLVTELRMALPKWNISSLAELVISELPTFWRDYEESRLKVIEDRDYLLSKLATLSGLEVFGSKANFAYIELDAGIPGVALRNRLLTQHGILLRECGSKIGSTSQYFRIVARPRGETDLLIDALREELGSLQEF